MASGFYNKEEVDEMIKKTKRQLVEQIDEVFKYGNNHPSKPEYAANTFSIKVLKSETV